METLREGTGEGQQPKWRVVRRLIDNYAGRSDRGSSLCTFLWSPQATLVRYWHGTGQKTVVFGCRAEESGPAEGERAGRLECLIYRLSLLKEALRNTKIKITPNRTGAAEQGENTESSLLSSTPPPNNLGMSRSNYLAELRGHA